MRPERNYGFLAMIIGIPVMFMVLPATQPFMFASLGVFSHAVLWIMDCMAGSMIFGLPPSITWPLVGAVVGACLGFWRVAPAVGRRRLRRLMQTIPLMLLGTLFLADAVFSLMTAPSPTPLAPVGHRGFMQPDNSQTQGTEPVATQPSGAQGQAKTGSDTQPAPGVYTNPTEDTLSPAPEGAGAIPDTSTPMQPDGTKPGTTVNVPPDHNPLNNLPPRGR